MSLSIGLLAGSVILLAAALVFRDLTIRSLQSRVNEMDAEFTRLDGILRANKPDLVQAEILGGKLLLNNKAHRDYQSLRKIRDGQVWVLRWGVRNRDPFAISWTSGKPTWTYKERLLVLGPTREFRAGFKVHFPDDSEARS